MYKVRQFAKKSLNLLKSRFVNQIKNNDIQNNIPIEFTCLIHDNFIKTTLNDAWNNESNWCTYYINNVYHIMYGDDKDAFSLSIVEHITIKIFPFEGVAFTHDGYKYGTKIINISSTYIKKKHESQLLHELDGVFCHELVHVFQFNGFKTAPGGFIEGLADFYRLRLGMNPPHWDRKNLPKKWDEGYEKTGFFLEWLDTKFPGSVTAINIYLRDHRWYDADVFQIITGLSIHKLFNMYLQQRRP